MACIRQELQSYLRKGIQLDELWRVARGEIQYKEFSSSQNGNGAVAAPPSVPEELVRCLPGLLLVSKHRMCDDFSWLQVSRASQQPRPSEGLYSNTSSRANELALVPHMCG